MCENESPIMDGYIFSEKLLKFQTFFSHKTIIWFQMPLNEVCKSQQPLLKYFLCSFFCPYKDFCCLEKCSCDIYNIVPVEVYNDFVHL